MELFGVLSSVLQFRWLTGWLDHVRQGREAVPNNQFPERVKEDPNL